MNEFFKAFRESKIPTLLVLLLLYGSGVWLLVHSGENPSASLPGEYVLLFAAILTLISFFDYRNKEEVERILKNNNDHTDCILETYRKALTAIGQTSATAEKFKQENLTSSLPDGTKTQTYGKSEYTIEPLSSTQTKK